MNFAQTLLLADSWDMHGGGIGAGWLIVMVPMMVLMMGGMMWMMMRGMGGGSSRSSSAPADSPPPTESALETLERRFAQGEISAEEYTARRDVLVKGTAEGNGAHQDEQLTAPTAGERRQR